jgi:conjugal transfer mating pair stabilization protein TraN
LLRKKEAHCCFQSKLGRIIREKVCRLKQVLKGQQPKYPWGQPESPDCSGFTIEAVEQLNFEEMNLDEFIADMQKNFSKRKG